MIDPELRAGFRWNERLTGLMSFVIVSLMLACATAAAVALGERLVPGWNGDYLAFLAIFAALDGMAALRALKHVDTFSFEWFQYRLTELVVGLVVIKLAIYLTHGWGQFWVDLPLWRENFIANFFTSEYMVAVLVLVVIWATGGLFAEQLIEMEGDEAVLEMERESRISAERYAIRRSLVNMILGIGAAMAVLASFLYLDSGGAAGTAGGRTASISGVIFALLAYFALSLVLLSLTQFSILRAHWSLDRIPISTNLASHWVIYSLGLLLVLGVLAGLLPTQYSLGLIDVLAYIFGFLLRLLGLLLVILLTPIFWLLTLVGRLMGNPVDVPPLDMQPLMPETPPPPPTTTGAAWLDLLQSILFWALFLALIVYSLSYYLRQSSPLGGFLRQFLGRGRFGKALAALLAWLRGAGQALGASVEAGVRRLRARASRLAPVEWEYINPRRLTPRQRVLFFYLAMLRRSGERGLSRPAGQTPSQYAESLRTQLPEAETDVEGITAEFLQARYSRHAITPEDAGLVRRYWERIRRVLGRRKG